MIQKLQEYDYKTVHRASQHHCNEKGLSRRPNDVPEWMPGEEEDLRGPIPDFESFDTALLGAEHDVKSARSKKNDADEDGELVNRHDLLHFIVLREKSSVIIPEILSTLGTRYSSVHLLRCACSFSQ